MLQFKAPNFFQLPQVKRLLSTLPREGLSYYRNTDAAPLVHRTIGQQLELAAVKYPNREAIHSVYENKAASFSELLFRSNKLAAGLSGLGLNRGDRIGIWMPNTFSWYIAMMAIARLGGICVAINPAYQTAEIEYCIRKVGIKAMITTETYKTQKYIQMLNEIFPEHSTNKTSTILNNKYGFERIILDSTHKHGGTLTLKEVMGSATESEITKIRLIQDQIDPNEGCNIQFTSGTTGETKAALLTHTGIINNGIHNGSRLEFDKFDHKVCLSVPLFHCYALLVGIAASLEHGTTMCIPSAGFNAAETINCIRQKKCTYVYGTPTMYVDVLSQIKRSQEKLESLQFAVTGGASITPNLMLDMQKYLGIQRIRSVLGMTECTITFVSEPNEDPLIILKTVGKLQHHMEAKVVDEQGEMVPFGAPGELWVRGYGKMLEYYGDSDKTNELIEPDGWIKTGDQFILYENGYGQIVGRLKEMINRGGEKVFPKEIEDFLNNHPSISEIFIIGVPDERLGEEIAAFIKLIPGKNDLTLREIKEFCQGKLAHFKVPKHICIVNRFPKTASGKIQKFKLARWFERKDAEIALNR